MDAYSADGRDDAAQRAVSDSFRQDQEPAASPRSGFFCLPDCEPVTGSTRVALEKRNAAYAIAREKCDSLANDAKVTCIQEAKARYGQT